MENPLPGLLHKKNRPRAKRRLVRRLFGSWPARLPGSTGKANGNGYGTQEGELYWLRTTIAANYNLSLSEWVFRYCSFASSSVCATVRSQSAPIFSSSLILNSSTFSIRKVNRVTFFPQSAATIDLGIWLNISFSDLMAPSLTIDRMDL